MTMSAKQFREIRKRLNLTKDSFAIELGLTGTQRNNYKTVSELEAGAKPISLPMAKLAHMLDLYGLPEWPADLVPPGMGIIDQIESRT